ncbi:MAG: hypothetical protein AAFW81_04805 [Pseudomonadota bacterium]
MLSNEQRDAVEEVAKRLKRRRRPDTGADAPPAPDDAAPETPEKTAPEEPAAGSGDDRWALENLRLADGAPVLDIANALRVLDRHPDFKGRFKFNTTLNKVMDRGSVMLDWRVAELVAAVQERFMPGIALHDVQNALLIHANRAIEKA